MQALHNVRRVTLADFAFGYRVAKGNPVACSGAWDRKGVISKVNPTPVYNSREGWVGYQVEVQFLGHFFAKPSQRIGNEYRYRYVRVPGSDQHNWETRKSRVSERSRMRFYGKTFVAARKHSVSKTIIWFDANGQPVTGAAVGSSSFPGKQS